MGAHPDAGGGRPPAGVARVVARVADLTAGAGARLAIKPGDGKSGSAGLGRSAAPMGLCQLAIMETFGWEKALGDDHELGWWVERAVAGARLLAGLEPGWR